ncbi:hypothetical protein, partial [Pelotomaculum propionicicum]|uniref:hypothetical protein n=1 Tax=Pelotomaculum propionicicum TaxID=258475 RepID=UPI0019617D19
TIYGIKSIRNAVSQFLKSPVREIRTPGSVGVGPPNGGPSTRRIMLQKITAALPYSIILRRA